MNRRPRIAVVSSYFPTREEPYRGHSAYQTLRQMTAEAELHAFCPLPAYPSWYTRTPREFRYQRMDLSYSPKDVPASYFEYTVIPWISRPFNGEVCYRLVVDAVRRFQPDMILNYWLYPDGLAAVRCGQSLATPVAICALGSDLRRINDGFTRFWTRYALKRASRVLTVSEELRTQALALGAPPEKTRTILNGFDPEIFYPGSRDESRSRLGLPTDGELILYVGSLIPSKGIGELIEAFQALSVQRPNLRLACAGEGPLKSHLLTLSSSLGGRILVPGKCSPQQVREWMVASDLFCLPSYSEGCPNVIIEALACGRPVVATSVGGIPELIHPRDTTGHGNGLLVPPRNGPALQQALAEALSGRWSSDDICASFTRTWRHVAEETWEVCSTLLRS